VSAGRVAAVRRPRMVSGWGYLLESTGVDATGAGCLLLADAPGPAVKDDARGRPAPTPGVEGIATADDDCGSSWAADPPRSSVLGAALDAG
jgi:hypothetical protein